MAPANAYGDGSATTSSGGPDVGVGEADVGVGETGPRADGVVLTPQPATNNRRGATATARRARGIIAVQRARRLQSFALLQCPGVASVHWRGRDRPTPQR